MNNESKTIPDNKSPMKLVLSAKILNNQGEVLIEQELNFAGQNVAIHDAIKTMGSSFIYGLGLSTSQFISNYQINENKKENK